MTTVYLHIGFHKTGSTSLQELLRANRGLTKHRLRILVQGDDALRPLEDACRAYDRRSDQPRAFAIQQAWLNLVANPAGSPDTWIVSTENVLGRIPSTRDDTAIYRHGPAILALLQDTSTAIQLEVCAYLRGPKGWLDSIHRHLVRTRGLAISAETFHALEKFSTHPDPLADAANRIDAVLRHPLHRFTLEDDSATRLGPGTSLLQLAGLTAEDLMAWTPVERQNEGLDKKIITRMSTPTMLRLPRLIRRLIIKRMQRRG